MDKKDRDSTSSSVLLEIMDRIAAITPQQYIPPQYDREKDVNFVCIANDSIKRLYTLRQLSVDKMQALDTVMRPRMTRIQKYIAQHTGEALRKEFNTPGSRFYRMRTELERMSERMKRAAALTEAVDGMFRLEIYLLDRNLARHTACVYSDWSVCWKQEELPAGLLSRNVETELPEPHRDTAHPKYIH